MPSALEKIVNAFPHPTVSPIVGQPSYKTIAELQLKLNTNAASIYSHCRNGRLGLLFLTVKPAVGINRRRVCVQFELKFRDRLVRGLSDDWCDIWVWE